MKILYYITSVLFFIWIIRNVLFWIFLWQLKEYRLDRVLIHLRETGQGKKLLFSPLSVIKFLAIIVYVFVVFNNEFIFASQIFILLIFVVQIFFVLKDIYRHQIRRPVFTVRALLTVFLTLGFIFLLYSIPLFEKFVWLVFLDKFTPFIIAFFVFLFYFPTELFKDWKIDKATQKMESFKKITVIGVTGSYGKSSTKEYVSQILSNKFKVLKTRGTNNTPIGIANTVLNGLNKTIEVFVVEMGAYKRGEIKEMCEIVHPKIGIITAVNDQHLSLFGNIKNTMKAKYELIDSLPKNGLGLFNGNNENTATLYEESKKKKVLYKCLFGKEVSRKEDFDIAAYNILTKKNSIEFDVYLQNRLLHFKAPLIGQHNTENILPGIYVASYLGMADENIINAVSNLSPLPKTMVTHSISSGATVIDDTFNANPQAVLAAISYAKIYKGKKILVMQPMIELGAKGNDEHYRIAKEISKICDHLFLTNRNFYKYILKGINEGRGKCEVKMANSSEIAEFINKENSKEDIVIFEGKEAAFTLNRIL